MSMRFFDRKLSGLVLILSIPLLFLPKINLIKLGESETAGIRIDDVVLFFLFILFGWAHFILNKRINKIEGWVLIWTAFSLLSFLLNKLFVLTGLLRDEAKIFYVFRFFEYFLFFYIGVSSTSIFSKNRVVSYFFLWNFVIILLQKFSIIGAMTSEGYVDNVSTRVYGVASFPSEMGLLLNLLFCYFIYLPKEKARIVADFPPLLRRFFKKSYLYLVFLVCTVLVIWTGNRISIVAIFICFLFKLKSELSIRSIGSLVAIAAVVIGLLIGSFYLISMTESVYKRSEDLLSWKNLSLVEVMWDRVDFDTESTDVGKADLEGYDLSWLLRIHKWMYAIKMYVYHPECCLQGLGPGANGAALDGGLLRILTEYGLIGSWIFWKIFSLIAKLNLQLKWMVIALFINMVFFDAYLAYKIMSLLFFAAGHGYALKLRQSDSYRHKLLAA
jgi:hypothetical protein